MDEQRERRDINSEVKRFPQTTSEAHAEVRGNHYEGEEIKRHSSKRIFQRLAGRMHRKKQIAQAEHRLFIEQQQRGMQ
jgi:hypothetical protein